MTMTASGDRAAPVLLRGENADLEENLTKQATMKNGTSKSQILDVSTVQARRRQALAVCVAGGGCFVNGCLLGFTATAGPYLNSNKSKDVYGQPMAASMQDLSWIASLLFLGCFFGHLVSLPMLDKLGRKTLLGPVTGSLFVAANALVLLAGNVYLVMAGRFVGGVAMGIQLNAAAAYVSEVTKRDVKGAAGYAATQLAGSLGAAVTTWMGAAAAPHWWSLPLLPATAAVLSAVAASLWAPESPRWLLQRGREYSAAKSLEWLRGRNDENVDTELDALKRELSRQRYEERRSLSAIYRDQGAVKALLASFALMLISAFSGAQVIFLYLGNILRTVRVATQGLSVSGAVAIGGLFLLVSSPFSAAAVAWTARSGRRRKIVTSSSAAAAAACLFFVGWCVLRCEQAGRDSLRDMLSPSRNETLARLGLDVRLADQEREFSAVVQLANAPPRLAVGWPPLLALCLAILVSNVGFGTLVWATITDLVPPRVLTVSTRLSTGAFYLSSFVAAKTFVDLSESSTLDMSGTIFMYATVCFVGSVVTIFLIPQPRDTDSIVDI